MYSLYGKPSPPAPLSHLSSTPASLQAPFTFQLPCQVLFCSSAIRPSPLLPHFPPPLQPLWRSRPPLNILRPFHLFSLSSSIPPQLFPLLDALNLAPPCSIYWKSIEFLPVGSIRLLLEVSDPSLLPPSTWSQTSPYSPSFFRHLETSRPPASSPSNWIFPQRKHHQKGQCNLHYRCLGKQVEGNTPAEPQAKKTNTAGHNHQQSPILARVNPIPNRHVPPSFACPPTTVGNTRHGVSSSNPYPSQEIPSACCLSPLSQGQVSIPTVATDPPLQPHRSRHGKEVKVDVSPNFDAQPPSNVFPVGPLGQVRKPQATYSLPLVVGPSIRSPQPDPHLNPTFVTCLLRPPTVPIINSSISPSPLPPWDVGQEPVSSPPTNPF
ncbi:hypothetical protein AMTRI_Chr01g135400 [Amborella trichopoda]